MLVPMLVPTLALALVLVLIIPALVLVVVLFFFCCHGARCSPVSGPSGRPGWRARLRSPRIFIIHIFPTGQLHASSLHPVPCRRSARSLVVPPAKVSHRHRESDAAPARPFDPTWGGTSLVLALVRGIALALALAPALVRIPALVLVRVLIL